MQIQTTLEKVNQAIQKLRSVGSVDINGSGGRFRAKGVAGRFYFDQEADNTLEIVIDDKPFLASDSMIESEIKKFFS